MAKAIPNVLSFIYVVNMFNSIQHKSSSHIPQSYVTFLEYNYYILIIMIFFIAH